MSNYNHLLVDGYISYTFQPEKAKTFFDLLIQQDSSRTPVASYGDYSYRIQVAGGLIILDFAVDRKGTVVPQEMWRPSQSGDQQRYVTSSPKLLPVFFLNTRGFVGLEMGHAYASSLSGLVNAAETAPLGGLTTTHLCLKWPGYPEYKKQIEIKDTHGLSITIGRLAERIARFVDRFIEHHSNGGTIVHPWMVGPGRITKDHMYIIGLVQVSAGTWMPLLQLNHFII